VNTQAPYFFARGADDIAHCLSESIFTAYAGMEAAEDKQLHHLSSIFVIDHFACSARRHVAVHRHGDKLVSRRYMEG
jgi:hypothetical protein